MSSVLIHIGAVDKLTNNYVLPINANKFGKYKCPECNEKVILKKGNIRRVHFSHMSDSACKYFEHIGESQIHKYGKELLKYIIQYRKLFVLKKCAKCGVSMSTTEIHFQNNTVDTEFIFNLDGNKKIADVAIIGAQKEIIYIFEIFHKHRTDDNDRPEPWFEINVLELCDATYDATSNTVILTCARYRLCTQCQYECTLNQIIIFGKYANKKFRILLNDKNYVQWLIKQTWFKSKTDLYEICVDKFGCKSQLKKNLRDKIITIIKKTIEDFITNVFCDIDMKKFDKQYYDAYIDDLRTTLKCAETLDVVCNDEIYFFTRPIEHCERKGYDDVYQKKDMYKFLRYYGLINIETMRKNFRSMCKPLDGIDN